MWDVALQKNAPLLHGRGRFEAKGFEGDRDETDPALFQDPGVAGPNRVPGKIDIVLSLHKGPLLLDAGGVDEEEDGVAVVVESIENDADLVFFVDLFAADHVIAEFVYFGVEREENDVEILVGVTEIGLGLLRDRDAVLGIVLPELVDLEHGTGKYGRGLHFGEVFEFGFSGQVRDVDRGEMVDGVFGDREVGLRSQAPEDRRE